MTHASAHAVWRVLLATVAAVGLGSCGSDSPESPGALSCSVTPASGEAPLTVTFSATGKDTNPDGYYWVFNDGTAATGRNIARTYSTGGIYSGRVTMTSTGESCATGKVAVGGAVRLTCTADPNQLIVPNEVHFGAQPAGGDGTFTYAWDFGDGTTSAEKDPVHPYQKAGSYPIKVTATSAGFSATCTTGIRAFDGGLDVSCSADPNEGEAPLTVNFRAVASGGSGTYTYLWQFGEGSNTSTNKTASHTYQSNGIYEPRVTVQSANVAGVCQQKIYVNRTIICGDDLVEPGEACDDGNTTAGDGCSATCTVEPGWVCNGKRSKCDGICGDGLIRGTEGCDDANTTPGDGCNAKCKVEPGFTCSGEPSVCT